MGQQADGEQAFQKTMLQKFKILHIDHDRLNEMFLIFRRTQTLLVDK